MNHSFLLWGLDCGRLFGIPIRLHLTFIMFAVMELLQASGAWHLTLLYLVLVFGTVLAHELGHCFGARYFGLEAERVVLLPFGGLAFTMGGRDTRQDFWITLAGPIVHIPIALVCALWLWFQGGSFVWNWDFLNPISASGFSLGLFNVAVATLFHFNVLVFALNVFLPAYPMDGGRMLVATVLGRLGPLKTSLMALVLTCLSALYLLRSGYTFLGILLLFEAARLYQARQTGEIYHHPSFNRPAVAYAPTPKKRSRTQEASHLRLVASSSKHCPKCGRSLPEQARMCGFCEIQVV